MDPVLKQQLDAFVSGESNPVLLVQELTALCDATPDSAWDVLSLTDQYFRRGKVSREVLRALRARIIPHVLGATAGSAAVAGTARVAGSAQPSLAAARPDPGEAERPVADPAEDQVRAVLQQELDARRQEVEILQQQMTALQQHVEALQHRVDTLQRDATRAHATLERYRHRIGLLIRYGRRRRDELAQPVAGAVRAAAGWRAGPATLCLVLLLATGVLGVLRLAPRPERARPAPAAVPAGAAGGILTQAPRTPAAAPPGSQIGPQSESATSDRSRISLAADRLVVFPREVRARIEVRRDAATARDARFLWWTQGGGAKPGRDYVAVRPQTAVIPAGSATAQLVVPVLLDPARRHTEFFYVVIGKPGDGTRLGSITRASVFLLPGT